MTEQSRLAGTIRTLIYITQGYHVTVSQNQGRPASGGGMYWSTNASQSNQGLAQSANNQVKCC